VHPIIILNKKDPLKSPLKNPYIKATSRRRKNRDPNENQKLIRNREKKRRL
jgi:hypothetical protein